MVISYRMKARVENVLGPKNPRHTNHAVATRWDRFVRHAKEFGDRLAYMHLNPVRKGLVAKPENWRWSSNNNYALDKQTVVGCPIQVDDVWLPEGYRA